MRHPSMSTRGTRLAFAGAVLVACLLPRSLPCTYPNEPCGALRADGRLCKESEVEPFGVYLLEYLVGRDLGLRYSSATACE